MALLSIGLPVKAFDGEGGAYYIWKSTDLPLLSEAKVGAAKLVLEPQGFALPHYSECTKIGFVLHGSPEAKAGIISTSTMEEKVMNLNKGDIFIVIAGSVSWWFNGSSDTVLEIIFLGETNDAKVAGEFSYQYIAGSSGVLKSFSTEFISSAYSLTVNQTNELLNSQTGGVLIKVEGEGKKKKKNNLAAVWKADIKNYNLLNVKPEVEVSGGGFVSRYSFGEGLSGIYMRLEPGAVYGPMYVGNVGSAVQVIYVVKGKFRVEVVDMKGELVLSKEVESGYVFVVPKYYTIAMIAGEDGGAECFTVTNCSEPVLTKVSSVIKALCPEVMDAAFNLDPECGRVVVKKIGNTSLIIPRPQR